LSTDIELNVLDIYLDSDNPRHELIDDQADIIQYLVEHESIRALAKDIAANGLNPLDKIGVVKNEDGNYVVVEGNRRICALQLLNDPSKAPTVADAKFFRNLSATNDQYPSEITCSLLEDFKHEIRWVTLRHSGEQNGVGIRGWDSEQKSRNNARLDKKDPNALALTLIDYATKKGYLPKSREEKIMTTAARYLGNPIFRGILGIVTSRSEKSIQINANCQEFDWGLKKFCDDLIENDVVNSRTSKSDWESYANYLFENGYAPRSKVAPRSINECLTVILEPPSSAKPSGVASNPTAESSITDGNEGDNSESDVPEFGNLSGADDTTEAGNTADTSSPPSKEQGNNKNPDTRKYIVPHDFKVTINNKILKRAFNEMKAIPIDNFPLSVSLVTRAFLENIYIQYNEKVCSNTHKPNDKVHVILSQVINGIESHKDKLTKSERNSLAALKRVQSNENNPLSPNTLGANAHAGIYPDATSLKREFDNISEILKYMIKRI
jgi:hypothetical protein